MTSIREIGPDDWQAFRAIRLAALAESPSAFGSTLADAEQRTDSEWEQMVRTRSTSDLSAMWLAELDDGTAVGVVGADRALTPHETELVSMWVAPSSRGTGLARRLIDAVLVWSAAGDSTSVSLWVMRGNEAAQHRYESAGFVVTDDHQAPPNDPCRDEIRMIRPLGVAAGRGGTRSATPDRGR